MKIKKNDNVIIIAGKDKGKKGKVRQVLPKANRLLVEGFNLAKRHSKTKGQARQGGIIELEAPMDVSNVMLVCPKCSKPARVGYRVMPDGKKVRICHICEEVID
ncbi:MAG: 50S ribosomal protein L24 [Chloroflexi bacterium RBG_16_48_7]|nr:MAG: 50S ribosomal protein L24 [Chloroflexi bacterium RBG_16_48_7]